MDYYLKKQKFLCIIVCVFQALSFTMNACIQFLLMKIFDSAAQMNFNLVLFWCCIDIFGWGLYLLFSVLADRIQAKAIWALNNDVRKNIYDSILRQNYKQYHKNDIGEYLSWVTNDIKQIEQLAWIPFFSGVGRVTQVIVSIISLAFLHWSLVLFALLSAFLMWSIPNLFHKKIEKLGKNCSQEQSVAISQLKDLFLGMDTLKTFGRGERFLGKSESISDNIERPNYILNATKADTEGIVGFVNVTLQVVSMLLIVLLVMQGKVMLGVLASGTNLIGGVSNGLSGISNTRLSLIAARPYFEKLSNLNTDGEHKSNKILSTFKKKISVTNVSFNYREKTVLKNISFVFEKGKKYALIGPSGCGKSTFLKILLGWLPDYTGNIYFDDTDIRMVAPEQLQQQIGYVDQNVFLFNTTIRENITLGGKFAEEQIKKAVKDSALEYDISSMPNGLDTIVGENGNKISGGQKQRIAIARALIYNRSILLIDEGTSALDEKNAERIEKCLLENPRLTLILVSHHLTEARKRQFDEVYKLDTP